MLNDDAICVKYVVVKIGKDVTFKDPNGDEWGHKEWIYMIGYYTPDGKWHPLNKNSIFELGSNAQASCDRLNGIGKKKEKNWFQRMFE